MANKVSEDWEHKTLLKLKREYTSDEKILFLQKKLNEIELEHGKDKSYIYELEHTISNLNQDISDLKETINYTATNKELKNINKALIASNSSLLIQNNKLKERVEKQNPCR